MKNIVLVLFGIIAFSFISCTDVNEKKHYQDKLGITLADSNATYSASALFYNLRKTSEEKIIFGHHHATAYGIGWKEEDDRSDIKDITGVHPGLIGWDFLDLPVDTIPDSPQWLSRLVPEAYNQGIINIFAWHMNNPVTGKSFYDTTVVVKHILPGGSHHAVYKRELDKIAQFLKHTIGADGKIVPVIFRPFHEFDGSWFWWGKNFCTAEEFKKLWKFTVEYLRDFRNVSNVLYAFSPDRNFYSEEDFLERYPGDNYVDLIGMDNYWDFKPEGDGLDAITKKLKIITRIAEKKNKIAAFTETGSEKIPNKRWWTDELFHVMDHDSINIAFVMVWRNAHLNHFYAPYKGHPSEENFLELKNNPKIIFSDELPDMYSVDW